MRPAKCFALLLAVLTAIPLLSSCSGLSTAGGDVSTDRANTSKLDIYFVKPKGEELELIPVKRPKSGKDLVKVAVEELLKGPDDSEIEKGIASEIPRGTILLGIERETNKIELDLSKRFAAGGGAVSMQARLDQLARTVSSVAGQSKVFLNIEGSRLTASNADGLEIKQPIN